MVVLGGDGTMLHALGQFLGTGIPVLGVNYGRVGFLTAISADELEAGLARAFAGELRTVELADARRSVGDVTRVAVNDVVVAGGTLGRMFELGYSIGGEDLGHQSCDGLIGATPAGSTAYNLSNGGPVLVWGLDAMVLTFVAPHSLHIRPLVVPRGPRSPSRISLAGLDMSVLVDGHPVGSSRPTSRRDPARRAVQLARDPARGDVLPTLRRHLRPMMHAGALRTMEGCCARSGSRTSCSSTRPSSTSTRA